MQYLPLNTRLPVVAVRSVMLFPADTESDAAKRAAHYDHFLGQAAKQAVEVGITELPPDLAAALERKTPLPKGVATRWQKGFIIGNLFKLYFGLALNDPKKMSWYNVFKAIKPELKQRGLPCSDAYLWQLITDFKPVAHLWAAYSLRDFRFNPNADAGFTLDDDLNCFLHEAEILRYYGRGVTADYDKAKPPLDAETWSVPPDWRRREPEPDWPQGVGEVPHFELPKDVMGALRAKGRPTKRAGGSAAFS